MRFHSSMQFVDVVIVYHSHMHFGHSIHGLNICLAFVYHMCNDSYVYIFYFSNG
jgi:hypothetical protein